MYLAFGIKTDEEKHISASLPFAPTLLDGTDFLHPKLKRKKRLANTIE